MAHPLTKSAKSHANDLIDRIRTRKDDIARAFYDIGSLLRELHEKKLFAVLGYDSFDAMLHEREIMSGQYARKLIQVSAAFDRDQAQRLGPDKAYALVRYAARTKLADDPVEYVTEGFPVPGGKRRPIDDVNVREITEATRTAVLKQKGQHSASEAARRDAVAVARRAHAKIGARTSDQVTVRHLFRKGSWWIQIEVPAELADIAIR